MAKAALLVVDVQNDFFPGGALPVPHADAMIPDLDRVISAFADAGLPVFFTRDWHPVNHCSFKALGGPWPPHCVQGTPGAEIHKSIPMPAGSQLVSKGDDPDRDAYSGFQGTDLADRLGKLGVTDVYIGGLAVEYCVRTTTKDALLDGFAAHVIVDCVGGLEVRKGDSAAALREMEDSGASTVTSSEVIALVGAQQ
ncbi:MAG: isochorismatase family protein [Nitrososphaerota archaeon]|nr:isochorismatase family protein [Nitrososphaerota archaeon]